MSKTDAGFGWIVVWSVSSWNSGMHFLGFWLQEEVLSVDISGQILKEAEIADHLRIISGHLKYVLSWIMYYVMRYLLHGFCFGKRTEIR